MDLETKQEFLQLCKNHKNCLVIVEGLKDKETLKALGFKKVVTLNKPLFQVVENVADTIKEEEVIKEVIILTDLDKAGRKLYSRLKNELTLRKVRVNNRIRNFLFRTRYRQVQGLLNIIKHY